MQLRSLVARPSLIGRALAASTATPIAATAAGRASLYSGARVAVQRGRIVSHATATMPNPIVKDHSSLSNFHEVRVTHSAYGEWHAAGCVATPARLTAAATAATGARCAQAATLALGLSFTARSCKHWSTHQDLDAMVPASACSVTVALLSVALRLPSYVCRTSHGHPVHATRVTCMALPAAFRGLQ